MRWKTAAWGVAVCIAAAVATGTGRGAAQDDDEAKRVGAAATVVLNEMRGAPEKAIPQSIFDRAEAIAIFPSVKKAGFFVGGQWGRGIISVRDAQARTWSSPAFLTMTGGSVGAQIGGAEIDLILVIMNRRGVERLLANEVKLGGEVSAAAGPVGRAAEASTDLQLRAQILSYSRSRGLFAGAARSMDRPSRKTWTPTRASTDGPSHPKTSCSIEPVMLPGA